jgi:hypothetical protein
MPSMADLLRNRQGLPQDVRAAVDATPPTPEPAATAPASVPATQVQRDPAVAAQSNAAADAEMARGQAEAMRRAGITGDEEQAERGSEAPKWNPQLKQSLRELREKDPGSYKTEIINHGLNEGVENGNAEDHPHPAVPDLQAQVDGLLDPTRPQR